MIQPCAHIRDGKVVNISVWDGEQEWKPDETVVLVEGRDVGIGYAYDLELDEFTAPPEPEAV